MLRNQFVQDFGKSNVGLLLSICSAEKLQNLLKNENVWKAEEPTDKVIRSRYHLHSVILKKIMKLYLILLFLNIYLSIHLSIYPSDFHLS